MTARCRCQRGMNAPESATGDLPATTARSRWLGVARWLAPTVTLALLPKCPACLAAYIAIGTGVSVSLPVAAVSIPAAA